MGKSYIAGTIRYCLSRNQSDSRGTVHELSSLVNALFSVTLVNSNGRFIVRCFILSDLSVGDSEIVLCMVRCYICVLFGMVMLYCAIALSITRM